MSASKTEPQSQKTCATCGTPLNGPFCHQCGEKIVLEKDFRISVLLEQMVDIFTHLDSKLFKSFKALIFRPGLLTAEYIKGIRKPYMKPFQVFLLCNILFFLLLGMADIFLIPSSWFASAQWGDLDISKYAKSIAASKDLSLAGFSAVYDLKVTTNSKFFVVVLVPLIALCSYLFGNKQHREFGKHLIYGTHLLAFIMLASVIFFQLLAPVLTFVPGLSKFLPTATVVLYVFVSYRRFVPQSLPIQILASLSMGIWLIALLELYRHAISWATLWSMS